jgi:hypothetical protein
MTMPLPHDHLSPSSAWRPLGIEICRNLLLANLASDIGAFMQSVGGGLAHDLSHNQCYVRRADLDGSRFAFFPTRSPGWLYR